MVEYKVLKFGTNDTPAYMTQEINALVRKGFLLSSHNDDMTIFLFVKGE
jgi:hypothetical protein